MITMNQSATHGVAGAHQRPCTARLSVAPIAVDATALDSQALPGEYHTACRATAQSATDASGARPTHAGQVTPPKTKAAVHHTVKRDSVKHRRHTGVSITVRQRSQGEAP